jgi:hypothetical protein
MKGDFVDLFEIKDSDCCPYTALKKMAVYHKERVKNNSVVFSFSDGDLLTPKKFTDTVKGLLFNTSETRQINLRAIPSGQVFQRP